MFALAAADAMAQVPLAAGTRAQGMAGAYTAVADDASATWWNPAGLATGAYFSALLERSRVERHGSGSDDFQSGAWEFAIAYPALGISYYRFRVDEAGGPPPIGGDAGGREENTNGPGIRSIAVSQYGLTTGQTIAEGLVVATTLKLLRAGQLHQESGGGLADAEALDVRVATRFDVDLGLMASVGPVRLGGTLRNVTAPEFGGGGGDLRLDRQFRVGGALVADRLPWPVNLAVDVDVTKTRTVLGDVRHAAVGGETWLWERRFGLRGGVSVNTTGNRGETASGGASVMLRSGLHLQGAITRGSDKTREGWSLGLSASY
jgi:hypothetical protein